MPSALKIFMRGSRGVLGKPLEFHAAVYEEEGGGGSLQTVHYDIQYMPKILFEKLKRAKISRK